MSTFLGIEPDPAQGWPHAEQSFNAQPVSEMPPKVAHYLSLKYIGGLKELENCHLLDNVEFVKKWREDAEHYLEQYCRN